MKKKNNERGFTLAELLIVVAIIAVLVAIAIPIFTTQLEKSREAVDLSNMRAAYAECTAAVLTDSNNSYAKSVTIKQQKDGWASTPEKLAGTLDLTTDTVGKALGETNTTVFVCVDTDGVVSLATSAPTGAKTPS